MGDARILRQRAYINRKAMILAGNDYFAAIDVLYGMIGAMVAKLHFDGAST